MPDGGRDADRAARGVGGAGRACAARVAAGGRARVGVVALLRDLGVDGVAGAVVAASPRRARRPPTRTHRTRRRRSRAPGSPTEPAAVMFRSVVDSTVCVASVSANATPIEAVPPCVSPCAIVIAEAVSLACASRLPARLSGVPVPMSAELFTFEITTAMPGATATFGDEAPIFACVVIACAPFAAHREVVAAGQRRAVLDPGEGGVVHDRERERGADADARAARAGVRHQRVGRRRAVRRGAEEHVAGAGVHDAAAADPAGGVDRDQGDRDRACDADLAAARAGRRLGAEGARRVAGDVGLGSVGGEAVRSSRSRRSGRPPRWSRSQASPRRRRRR